MQLVSAALPSAALVQHWFSERKKVKLKISLFSKHSALEDAFGGKSPQPLRITDSPVTEFIVTS